MNTYLSSLQMNRSTRVRRNSNLNTRVAARRGLGPISNALFMAVILTLMGLLYLSQVTKASDYRFEISELQTQKEQLVQENQALSIEAARLSSIETIRTSDVASALKDPASVDFVR